MALTRTRTLADLAASVGWPCHPGWDRIPVSGLSEDSRSLAPGGLFVAIRGTADDGARYLEDAVTRGAVAVVSEGPPPGGLPVPAIRVPDARRALALLSDAFYGHPTRDLFTIGVTGTNGKTTVCHLISHLLGSNQTEIIGTVMNAGHGLAGLTTPPPPAVHRIARSAVDRGCRHLVLEASSIGLAQHRLDAVAFDVGVFTNLTHDHLDLHGSMEAYFEAKCSLFRALPSDAHAIVPANSPWTSRLLAETDARPVTYGLGQADVAAIDVSLGERGSRFRLQTHDGAFDVNLRLPGAHNVENALAASAVALSAGHRPAEVAADLCDAPPIPGRFEQFHRKDGRAAVVDFAHSPDALERILRTVRTGHQSVIAVFGCPGESDREKRPAMGEISGRLADVTILTADNPKREDLDEILDAIESGLAPTGARMERIPDRAKAIERAAALAGPQDVILVAGKGHEAYQIVGEDRIPYSDVAVLRSLGFCSIPAEPR